MEYVFMIATKRMSVESCNYFDYERDEKKLLVSAIIIPEYFYYDCDGK